MNYTQQELMVAAAAREIKDGEIVFVGMRLPLIAFAVAKSLHAPNAVGLFECGLVRDTPSRELLYTMADPPNVIGATWATTLSNVMGLMATGWIDLGFIGGAQIDRYGNLNTTAIGPDSRKPATRLPGSGGGADIASLAKRLAIIMAHEKRRFVERVDYITSPGYGTGKGWRATAGLPRGGPSALITTLAILRFDETGEAYLASYHPGSSVEEVKANTGWDLKVAADVRETEAPTADELRFIREYDPEGFWTR
ncbi:MAG: CoA-transferase subunit beta [Ardenticatenaceae bacterium]|nr:CoA-transferase subunit beta [Ardenticatenaceae bacterium]HBY92663.1 CoA-transferase [Chloroflexota bacterium]